MPYARMQELMAVHRQSGQRNGWDMACPAQLLPPGWNDLLTKTFSATRKTAMERYHLPHRINLPCSLQPVMCIVGSDEALSTNAATVPALWPLSKSTATSSIVIKLPCRSLKDVIPPLPITVPLLTATALEPDDTIYSYASLL